MIRMYISSELKSQTSGYHKGIVQRFFNVAICGLNASPSSMSTPKSPKDATARRLGSATGTKTM